MKRGRWLIFLKDVSIISLTALGGPHVHIPLFLEKLVNKRKYLSEAEFIELHALCQILPGPTSTQTLTAVGYKKGGARLAYMTLLIWILPSFILMTTAALFIHYYSGSKISMGLTRYIEPMAVGFISYAAWLISSKVIQSRFAFILMIFATLAGYILRSPWAAPVILLAGGLLSSYKYKKHEVEEKGRLKIRYDNFFLFLGVFAAAAILGAITQSPYVRLFENFYRNGSLIFGGGQVLIPLLYNEFVEFKEYLTSQEFLSGFALVQAFPGPVFSISSYLGTLSMFAMTDHGIWGAVLGSFICTAGIFLPGTFLIFFIYRFWDELKKYRIIKSSLEGINAAAAGLVTAAAMSMFEPVALSYINLLIISGTFILLFTRKIPAPSIILTGAVAGLIVEFLL